jgi:hypothetical protein
VVTAQTRYVHCSSKQAFITSPFMLNEHVNVCEEYEQVPSRIHIFIVICMNGIIIVSEDVFIITATNILMVYSSLHEK